MISKIMGFIGLNKIMIFIILGLTASTATAGYLLKKSYQSNGSYKSEIASQQDIIEQWQIANELSIQAYNNQKTRYEAAEKRLIANARESKKLRGELDGLQADIQNLSGGCLDADLGDDYWLLIEQAATAATTAGNAGLPGNQ